MTNKIYELEKRIERIENNLNLPHNLEIKNEHNGLEKDLEMPKRYITQKEDKTQKLPKLTFNQVITFLGITGITIGMIFFFFYAIANNWIGKTTQIGIGVIIGLLLFSLAYKLKEKNETWSYIVFGGSFFIEYLSIGIGVHIYKVLPNIIALILTLIFLISSLMLTLKFSSRIIGYFSLIGGYLIPFITDISRYDIFTLGFMFAISLALVAISAKNNWSDLRGLSFVIITIFISSSNYKFQKAPSTIIPILFLISIYILYNLSSIIYSLKNNKELKSIDSIILIFLPIVILSNLYPILNIGLISFGLIIMLNAFAYLIEIIIFKQINNESATTLKYSILGAGFTMLNLGIFLILKKLNLDVFLILFIIQWILFAYFSKISKDKNFYTIISTIFLTLIAIWYITILRFNQGLGHATIFMLILATIPIGFLFLNKKDIKKNLNGALFIISIFVYIFSLHKYLIFFIKSFEINQIILSVLWLIYTLGLLIFLKLTQKARIIIIILLSITLLKIAFNDMFYLEGAFRIIGFILFGILLLIGGYFIKNEQ